MTQQTQAAGRPPQVTMAGWVAMVGSAFLVLGLYDAIAKLRSLYNRELVAAKLKSPPYSSLGMNVEEWLQLSQTAFIVAGACAAVAGICGFYVLQKSKGARAGLSAAAVPLFFLGFIGGPFSSALVAVSAVLLWTGPARDWFAGRAVRQTVPRRPERQQPPSQGQAQDQAQDQAADPTRPPAPMPPHMPPPVWPPAGGSPVSTGAAPYSGFGAPRAEQSTVPLTKRPAPLVAACVVTWVCTLLVAGLLTLSALAIALEPTTVDELLKEQDRFAELGLTADQVRTTAFAMIGIFVTWSIVAAGLALLVVLRVRWARPLLIASAVLSGMLSFALVTAIAPIVTAVAGMVTAYLLLRPEVSLWLNGR
ncbi:hypothetical protein [Nocardioides cavernaquae]|uniref:hypothetical protein n=1 Tax=Nocardioides cavernaquae TaxID=2321396 RepID=UPI0011C3CE05|nr:hypothetical protein [Nocardioides cavernaquae]